MTLRRTLVALLACAALVGSPTAPAAAATFSCTIPSGTYRVILGTKACASLGWVAYGNGLGTYAGYVQDMNDDGVCASVQYKATPFSSWTTMKSDCTAGSGRTGIFVENKPAYADFRLVAGAVAKQMWPY